MARCPWAALSPGVPLGLLIRAERIGAWVGLLVDEVIALEVSGPVVAEDEHAPAVFVAYVLVVFVTHAPVIFVAHGR